MATAFLEIIELENGDVVLQRDEDDAKPMVRIHFSDEARQYMQEYAVDVGRVMIQAGIQAVSQLNEQREAGRVSDGSENRVLH